MAKWQSSRGWRRLIATPYAIGLIVLLGLLLAHSSWGSFRRQRLVREERAQVATELIKLEERERQLEADIALLQTDQGLERKIREKFLVVKEDEGVVALVPGPASATITTTSSDHWWRGWWQRD